MNYFRLERFYGDILFLLFGGMSDAFTLSSSPWLFRNWFNICETFRSPADDNVFTFHMSSFLSLTSLQSAERFGALCVRVKREAVSNLISYLTVISKGTCWRRTGFRPRRYVCSCIHDHARVGYRMVQRPAVTLYIPPAEPVWAVGRRA